MIQSSIHPEYDGPPMAVDGIADPDWHHGHCSSTLIEAYPWISVDMGNSYQVILVAITNRKLYCEWLDKLPLTLMTCTCTFQEGAIQCVACKDNHPIFLLTV